MSKLETGVSDVPQPSFKKPKLDDENRPFPDSLPTGESHHTSPISPPTLTPNSSDAHLLDDPDPDRIHDSELFGYSVPHAVPDDPRSQKLLHECFDFVVNEYNRLMKLNSQLVQAKIAKAVRTYVGGNIFFAITFEADDTVTQRHVTYQTDLCYWNNSVVINFIREEGQNKEFIYPVDLDDQNEKDRLNRCAVVAIASYNDNQQEKPRLEFVKIVKAARDMKGLAYHISIEARNPESRRIGTYYAEAMNFEYDDLEAVSFMPEDEMQDEFFFKLRYNQFRYWTELNEAAGKTSYHGA